MRQQRGRKGSAMIGRFPESSSDIASGGERTYQVIFLPGIIMPAGLRYQALIQALGDGVHAIAKDLDVYATHAPPPDYSIETEIAGVTRVADESGFERFHLYGHSGGGAIALAYVSKHPERVLSLALDEPASDFSPEAKRWTNEEMETIKRLPPEEQMGAFVSSQLAPGVEPPPRPSGPTPDWMAKRPAGVEAITTAFDAFTIDTAALRRFERPVYYSYGSLSNPVWEEMRARLATLFPDFTADRYAGLHHFNTSHAAEPERVAAALRRLWQVAENTAS
jgi:pimeloyl-ACP methyl ester carboxylesterase